MRALPWGLIALCLAAVLLRSGQPIAPSRAIRPGGPEALVQPASPAVQAPVSAPAIVAAAAPATDPGRAAPASASGERSSTAPIAATGSPRQPRFGIRSFVPGSKAHAAAIASALAAPEAGDILEPLTRLYFAYFDRVPDLEGLDYYTGERQSGVPLGAIAEEFAGSLEFRERYGSLDNGAFVDRLFQNVYGIAPDPDRRAYWTALLDSGGASRGEVMLAFSEAPEFRRATSNEVFVATAYAQALRRTPDAADMARWVAFLDAGHPRQTLIERLVAARRN